MTFSGEFLAFMGLALVAIIGGVLLIKPYQGRSYGRFVDLYLCQHRWAFTFCCQLNLSLLCKS